VIWPEGVKQFAVRIRSAFPDCHYAVVNAFTEADRVGLALDTLWDAQGRFLGRSAHRQGNHNYGDKRLSRCASTGSRDLSRN
jgi:hypothetical protein